MNTPTIRITVIAVVLTASSAGAVALSVSGFELKPGHSVLKSFKYQGCGGDWDEESSAPSVWKKQEGDSLIVLTKHAETCGYDRAEEPNARLVDGTKLILDYTLDTSSDMLAACICQYWAEFELSSSAAQATLIEVHGQNAAEHGKWPRGR